MSNLISLTIPGDDEKALVAGATMLLTLAGKVPNLELDDAVVDLKKTTPPPAPSAGDDLIATYVAPDGNSYVRCQLHKSGWSDLAIEALPKGESPSQRARHLGIGCGSRVPLSLCG